VPIFIIQGDLHQGFGLRRESWSIPNSLIIGQILSFYLIPWSKLISLLVWINKPYPHLVSLLVRVPIIISSVAHSTLLKPPLHLDLKQED